jgi:myo-inositol-1(or 4)-monophosphatase
METLQLISTVKALSAQIREIGDYARSQQPLLRGITLKNSKDVVTEVDIECDHRIHKYIRENFPQHGLLTEELGQVESASDYLWVADPLDGTINFAHQSPLWAVSVALLYKGQPLLGVSYLPVLGEMVTAVRGQGAFLNGNKIQVSQEQVAARAVISICDVNIGSTEEMGPLNAQTFHNHQSFAHTFQRVRCLGAAVVESFWVACGRLDAYVMPYSHPWDIAAGALFVEESGGKISQLNGDKAHFADKATIVFSNGAIHPDLIKATN